MCVCAVDAEISNLFCLGVASGSASCKDSASCFNYYSSRYVHPPFSPYYHHRQMLVLSLPLSSLVPELFYPQRDPSFDSGGLWIKCCAPKITYPCHLQT